MKTFPAVFTVLHLCCCSVLNLSACRCLPVPVVFVLSLNFKISYKYFARFSRSNARSTFIHNSNFKRLNVGIIYITLGVAKLYRQFREVSVLSSKRKKKPNCVIFQSLSLWPEKKKISISGFYEFLQYSSILGLVVVGEIWLFTSL